MSDVREILKKRPLLFDGGMGTYYKAKPGQECEQANLLDPDGILTVHRAYLEAGADAIKTNTFGLPRMAAAQNPMWEAMADEGWKLAAQAAAKTSAAAFADLGPAPDTESLPAAQIYTALAERFAALGAKNFLFETLSSDAGVAEAAKQAGTTRAVAAMHRAAREHPGAILAVGNAPTALLTIAEEIEAGLRPALVIGVPVGFVNVVESKETLFAICEQHGVPAIAAMGRKGGSNVAAAICNALVYSAAEMLDPSARGWRG